MTGTEPADARFAQLFDGLTEVLAKLEAELASDVGSERPRDLAFIESQVAVLCATLSGLPAKERAGALERLRPLIEQLDRVEQRVERHLASLSERLGPTGGPTGGGA